MKIIEEIATNLTHRFIEIGDHVYFPDGNVQSPGNPVQDMPGQPSELFLDIEKHLDERVLLEIVLLKNGVDFNQFAFRKNFIQTLLERGLPGQPCLDR